MHRVSRCFGKSTQHNNHSSVEREPVPDAISERK